MESLLPICERYVKLFYGIVLCKKVLTAETVRTLLYYSDKHINVIFTPLELIFDTDNNIQLVIDNDLMSDEYICGHPGINTSTFRLLREDMLKYVRAAKHEPTFIDLPTE